MTVSVAIIGLGIMGRRMLEHMGLHAGYEPWRFGTLTLTLVAQHRLSHLSARVTASAEQAIAAADLVYLACPPVPRKAYALAAAATGKAVFLEKPLGVDRAQSEQLVAGLAAHACSRRSQLHPGCRTGPDRCCRGCPQRCDGRDRRCRHRGQLSAWPRAWQKQADWLRFRAEGGMTREVISHFLFFSERILGPLSVVWARPSYPTIRHCVKPIFWRGWKLRMHGP
jgi:hypothetical protein